MSAGDIRNSEEIIDDLFDRYPLLRACESNVRRAYDMLCSCYGESKKVLVCGNGGSAADSEHIVGELMKSFKMKRKPDPSFTNSYNAIFSEDPPNWLEGALPAISLVSHTALSTAFSNDESAVGVFAQQVYGYGDRGDVLIAISTSGTSRNVIEAAKVAQAKRMGVIALMGEADAPLASFADVAIRVPCTETFKVQELHLPVYHALCAAVEAHFFGSVDD